MTYGSLRSCAIGGGHWAAHSTGDWDDAWYCPKHHRELTDGDPQPGVTVTFVDARHWSDPRSGAWVVLSRDDKKLSVKRIGFPDSNPVDAEIHEVLVEKPATSFSKGCGK